MNKGKRLRVTICDDVSADQLRQEAKKRSPKTAAKFEALAKILDGRSYVDVAKQHRVSIGTIYHWIHRLNERGIWAFEQKRRNGRKRELHVRDDISVAGLKTVASRAVRGDSLRLQAIAMLLANMTYQEVARDMLVSPSTLLSWVKKYNEGGIEGLLTRKRKSSSSRVVMRQDFSAYDIRMVAWCARRRTARRLLGISYVIEGMTLAEAARRLDVSRSAVSKWCQAYNEKGIEGIKSKSDRKARAMQASRIKSLFSTKA